MFFILIGNSQAASKENKSTARTQNETYSIPQREIILSPYVNSIYAKDLYADFVDDQFGIGGGMMARTQIYNPVGYFIDISYNKLDVNINPLAGDKGLKAVLLSSIGVYYSYEIPYGLLRFDLGYGAITAGNNAMTIFIPGVEFSDVFYDRLSYTVKIGYLLTNDWFKNLELKEKYTSLSLSGGVAMLF